MASQASQLSQCSQTQPLSYPSESDDDDDTPWGRLVPIQECAERYETVPLEENEYFFGRNKSKCAIYLNEPQISGIHCRILRDEDREDTRPVIWVYDLSSNGTFVNNRMIGKKSKALLADGDEILFIRENKARHGKKKSKRSHKPERVGYKFYLTNHEDDSISGKYLLQDAIGSGSFAKVYKGINRQTGTEVAIKEIDKDKYQLKQTSRRENTIMDEVDILQSVAHGNIIEVFDCFDTKDKLYLVMEMATGGELFNRISRNQKLSEPIAHDVFSQMLDAISYLHNKDIVHRDLKPENILMKNENDWVIKISDFGLSRILPEQDGCTTLCGTPYYLAPEVLKRRQNGGYGKEVDYWSMGVILYVMLCGHPPYDDRMGNLLDLVKEGRFIKPHVTWDPLSPEAKDLIERLMCVDVSQRLNEVGVKNHPWIVNHDRLKLRQHHTVGTKRRRPQMFNESPDVRAHKRMRMEMPMQQNNRFLNVPGGKKRQQPHPQRDGSSLQNQMFGGGEMMSIDTHLESVDDQSSPMDPLSETKSEVKVLNVDDEDDMDVHGPCFAPQPMFVSPDRGMMNGRVIRERDTDGDWHMRNLNKMARHMSVD